MFDVPSRTILLVKHGSHAYGLATPESDLDLKGVCIEPKAYHFGYLNHFEQSEKYVNRGHPQDEVIYSLKKFVSLEAECNNLYLASSLRKAPDRVAIDNFVVELTEDYLNNRG